jgi:aspartyl-tRNA(Asn)/glutamyl-tRNA(Gln) amidotransferase subunit C
MTLDKETLDKIAHLARLEIREGDQEKMLADMNNMVAFVEKLREVDTTGVEPLTTMAHEVNAMRQDEVKALLTKDEALSLAPKHDENFFRVPKVLE